MTSNLDGPASDASETTQSVDAAATTRAHAQPVEQEDFFGKPVTGHNTREDVDASARPDPFGSPTDPAEALSSARLLPPVNEPPLSGWRRLLWTASGGLVNPGESARDTAIREQIARVNQPLQGCYKMAVLSLKGGVGKTTVTAGLGATLASLRGDRIVAVDANPDRGTLAQKVPLETTATVRDLLRDQPWLRRYSARRFPCNRFAGCRRWRNSPGYGT